MEKVSETGCWAKRAGSVYLCQKRQNGFGVHGAVRKIRGKGITEILEKRKLEERTMRDRGGRENANPGRNEGS